MRKQVQGEPFSPFIREVLHSCNFDWYVKLGFDPEKHPRVTELTKEWESIWEATDPNHDGGWTKTPDTAFDCIEQWLDEIQAPGPCGPGVRDYFWLEERRLGGQRVFHILVANWNGFSDSWEQRWKQISHGWAKTRELDERTAGLLGYLVMRQACVLNLNCGDFKGRYIAEDFRPWNAKSY